MVTAIQAMCTTITLPALPAIAEDFHTSPDVAQLTISCFLIGVSCGQILAGALSDRFGRRPILLGGIALSVAAGAGCTFAPSIGSLIALRALQGFGGAAGMILGRAIVRDLFERERALKAMSGIAGIISIVPMAGPPIAGLLLHWWSWRVVYGLLTLISLTLGLMAWAWIGETLKKPDPTATDPRRILGNCLEMVRRPDSMGFVAVGCLTYGGFFSILALTPFVAADTFRLTAAQGGWILGGLSLATWCGTHINHRIAGRWPVRRALTVSTAIAFTGALAVLAVCLGLASAKLSGPEGLAALVLALAAVAFTFGLTHPTTIVMYLHPLPHIAGTASALGASFQTLTGAFFAWLAAYLYDGTPPALGYCVMLSLGGAFLVFHLAARRYSPA
jgi:DHA1 family bicyclomycin/chloramphenicol resistance-like MFS transporter